ncbi:hypothetical protein [Pyrofollis japonicus]|nr:hypothetical protein [Pyrofollis japonicus]
MDEPRLRAGTPLLPASAKPSLLAVLEQIIIRGLAQYLLYGG